MNLVTETACYPAALRLPWKNVFLATSPFPLNRFVEERVDEKGALGTGGSVAAFALEFALYVGAVSVWVAGLDLAFPGFQTHYRGARFEAESLSAATRTRPAETAAFHALRGGGPFYALDCAHERVLTDRRMSLYAGWFETRMKAGAQGRVWRLSDKGLDIPGLSAVPPERLLALPATRAHAATCLDDVLAKAKAAFHQTAAVRAQRYVEAVSLVGQPGYAEELNLTT
jgi:hypothetical protein